MLAVPARRHLAQLLFTNTANRICCTKKCCTSREKVRKLYEHPRPVQAFRDAREQARTLTLRGQCNDPYWHGVFGGLYSPHLRTALWRSLIQAEAIADALSNRNRPLQSVATMDFDSDGRDEIYFTSDRYAAVLCPGDGATISALDCRQSNAALVNSLARRPESYHAKLKNLRAGEARGAQSIHEQTRAKETGLDRWLNYDRWARHCFRLLLFGREKKYPDCGTAQLEEDAGAGGGRYRVAESVSQQGESRCRKPAPIGPPKKPFRLRTTPDGFDILCDRNAASHGARHRFGLRRN